MTEKDLEIIKLTFAIMSLRPRLEHKNEYTELTKNPKH